MARTYTRDARGRFASNGGGGGRPRARMVSRGANRITRDNAGRITSVGGTGATARGGRLRTAGGKLRATQLAKLKGTGGRLRKPVGSRPRISRAEPLMTGGTLASHGRPVSYRSRSKAAAAQSKRSRSTIEQTRGSVIGMPRAYRQTAGAGQKLRISRGRSKQMNLLTGKTDTVTRLKARPVPSSMAPAPGSRSARRGAGINARSKMSNEDKRKKTWRRVHGSEDLRGRKTLSITERRQGREGFRGSAKRRSQSIKTQKRAAQYLDARRRS